MIITHFIKIDEISKIARKKKIIMIEDAAESLELFDYSDLPFYLQSPYSHYERMIREYIVNEHKVLEIGSGTGNYTGYISSTGADVMATDISSKSLEVASLRYSKNKNIKYQAADMEQLPFSDESFDVICSAGSLSYGSYAKVSKEIKRVLKSGGYFICVDSLNNNPIVGCLILIISLEPSSIPKSSNVSSLHDLGFYLFYDILKKEFKLDIQNYLEEEVFSPLEAFRIQYNPIEKYPKNNIVPTEDDKLFRKQLLHGYVHDQGVALFGGIGLHAGLFSNAIDLVKILQLYLNEGEYNNHNIFERNTIQSFTSAPFKNQNNRRGIFFDKPSLDPNKLNVFSGVSDSSYGHTGFTGTMVWVDPELELIYIFLSNRVYPKQDNWKLTKENIRTKVQQTIYESILK